MLSEAEGAVPGGAVPVGDDGSEVGLEDDGELEDG